MRELNNKNKKNQSVNEMNQEVSKRKFSNNFTDRVKKPVFLKKIKIKSSGDRKVTPSSTKDQVNKNANNSTTKGFFIDILAGFMLFFIGVSIIVFVSIFAFFKFSMGEQKEVAVPNVLGKDALNGILKIQEYGFFAKIENESVTDPSKVGKILSQDPSSGSLLKIDAKIVLKIGSKIKDYIVENYLGKDINQVKDLINSYNSKEVFVKMGNISYIEDEDNPEGIIISQDPKAGSKLKELKKINFLVSKKKKAKQLVMGNFIGTYFMNAINTLAPMDIPFEFTESNDFGDGKIISQSIEEGQKVDFGDKISFTISPLKSTDNRVFGIISLSLPVFSKKTPLEVNILEDDLVVEKYFSTKHLGGSFSFPYFIKKGLTLQVVYNDEEVYTQLVE